MPIRRGEIYRVEFVVIVGPAESGLPATNAINCSQLATIQEGRSSVPG